MDHTDLRISFPWQPDRSPAFLREREWLVTNGLGGYASGTLLGWADPPSRRLESRIAIESVSMGVM